MGQDFIDIYHAEDQASIHLCRKKYSLMGSSSVTDLLPNLAERDVVHDAVRSFQPFKLDGSYLEIIET